MLIFTAFCAMSATGCAQSFNRAWRSQCLRVLESVLDDPNPVVMTHAAEALIAAGRRDGLRARFEVLLSRDEPDRDQRELRTILAARILYLLGDEQAIGHVRAIINDPRSPRRHTAAETIGKLRDRSALDDVRRAVAGEDPPAQSALWAYGVGALVKCGDADARELMLVEGFASLDENVRRITANDLSTIQFPRALPKVRAMAAHESDPLTQVDVAGALLRYGDASGMPVLRSALDSDHAIVRKHALRAFRAVQDESVIPLLLPRLQDPDADARVLAADAVLHVLAGGDEQAVGF